MLACSQFDTRQATEVTQSTRYHPSKCWYTGACETDQVFQNHKCRRKSDPTQRFYSSLSSRALQNCTHQAKEVEKGLGNMLQCIRSANTISVWFVAKFIQSSSQVKEPFGMLMDDNAAFVIQKVSELHQLGLKLLERCKASVC